MSRLENSIVDTYLSQRSWGSSQNWCREKCKCGATRRFYCPDCRIVVGSPFSNQLISADPLPLKVDIILRDDHTKSTGVHAAVLSPLSATIYNYPKLDECEYDFNSSVVLYPSPSSVTLNELSTPEIQSLRQVIVIDSKWTKTNGVLEHKKLAHLRHVRLQNPPQHSNFWRYHDHGEGCISTIEALVLLLFEYKQRLKSQFVSTDCNTLRTEDKVQAPPQAATNDSEESVFEHSSKLQLDDDRIKFDEKYPETRLLLLFGLIRDAILEQKQLNRKKSCFCGGDDDDDDDDCPVGDDSIDLTLPMDERAKEVRRAQRRQKGTLRQQHQMAEARRKQQRTK